MYTSIEPYRYGYGYTTGVRTLLYEESFPEPSFFLDRESRGWYCYNDGRGGPKKPPPGPQEGGTMTYREYLEVFAALPRFGVLVNTIAKDCLVLVSYNEFKAKVGELHDLL